MKYFLILGALIWLAGCVYGTVYLANYESTPTEMSGEHPQAFPSSSKLERRAERPTLIFFSHPKCPCTRASLNELSRLIADVNGNLQAYVVFIKPQDADENWTNTDLRYKAEAIPGVTVIIDENERETDLFNAQTSGTVLLYDRSGNLRFEGGITSARGHEGDNAGRQAIYDIITKDSQENAETFIFGCPLHNRECPTYSTETETTENVQIQTSDSK